MRNAKVKHYDAWGLKALKSGLLETMGDLYCFVWDLRQPVVENQALVIKGIGDSAHKSYEIMLEIERRGH
jgi:hypothetical protein